MQACDGLTVDHEFEQLLSPLSEEELSGLHESIRKNGCLSPLVVWDGLLLDGHNRYRFCSKNNIAFDVRKIDLPDRNAAYNWIIDNQLSRRNVTPQMASYLRGRRYLVEKQDHGGERKASGQNVHLKEKTAEVIASHFGVDEKTIRRDAEFAKAVDKAPEEARAAILSGKSGATKKQVIEAAESGNFAGVANSANDGKPRERPLKPKRVAVVGGACAALLEIERYINSAKGDELKAKSVLRQIIKIAQNALGR